MRKYSKILVFLLLLIPIRVNAISGNITLNCPSSSKGGEKISCNVVLNTDGLINAISTEIVLSDNLEFYSFEKDIMWEGDATGGVIGLYSSTNYEGELNLGTINVKVKANTSDSYETVSLQNGVMSADDFSKVNIENVGKEIKILSSNNKLSNLEVLPGTIDFNPDTLNYNLTVDSPSINITPVKENENAVISGDTGSKKLNYGLNTFKITVTSEDGIARTYTINVTRTDSRSTENRLATLSISGTSFNFNENKYSYSLSVDYNTDNVKISANLKDNKSSFVKGYEPGTKVLEEGNNKIELKVQAENGKISTYVININRDEDPENKSDDSYLENLDIDIGSIDFTKEQEEYQITVPYDTDTININAITSSKKSKVEISGNDNLQVGTNVVTVKVTAASGEVREYKITVIKKEEEVIIYNNTYLKSLIIEGYELDFKRTVLTYKLNVKEDKLNITALPEDEKSTVKITGNENLKDGSSISIMVTAEDGTRKEYRINISKKIEIDYIKLSIIAEIIIIVGVIVYFNVRKKGKEYNEEI